MKGNSDGRYYGKKSLDTHQMKSNEKPGHPSNVVLVQSRSGRKTSTLIVQVEKDSSGKDLKRLFEKLKEKDLDSHGKRVEDLDTHP